jgi:hypothetical protein
MGKIFVTLLSSKRMGNMGKMGKMGNMGNMVGKWENGGKWGEKN